MLELGRAEPDMDEHHQDIPNLLTTKIMQFHLENDPTKKSKEINKIRIMEVTRRTGVTLHHNNI